MRISESYRQLLNTKGVAMSDLGISEAALTRSDTLHAITLLKEDRIPILGGDVYWRHESVIEPLTPIGTANRHWETNQTISYAEVTRRRSVTCRSLLVVQAANPFLYSWWGDERGGHPSGAAAESK